MTETLITSRDNPIFKRLKKLADSGRARREARMTLLDGEHLLKAYLDAGGRPRTVVRAASSAPSRFEALMARCTDAKALVLSDALFVELSPVASPVGLLAEVAWLVPVPVQGDTFAVVLEDIQDPGNLGSVLRTAAAAGATLAILSKGCHDPWSPKALRGGQGAQFVLPLRTGVDLAEWLGAFHGRSVALTLAEDSNFYALDLTGPLAVVVGNEGAGLSAAVCTASTVRAQIPMRGAVESLNVSAALAVAVFESMRQRRVAKAR